MANLSELGGSIQSRAEQISQAEKQVQAFNPNIVRTQQMLRQAPAGTNLQTQQARLNEAERLRSVAKQEALKQIEGYKGEQAQLESQYQQYLQSDAGKLQYAQENKLTSQPVYDRIVKGGAIEVVGYKYDTPYGTVTDYSPKQALLLSQYKSDVYDYGKLDTTLQQGGFSSLNQYAQAGTRLPQIEQAISSIQGKAPINERGQVQIPTLEVGQIMSVPKALDAASGQSLMSIPNMSRPEPPQVMSIPKTQGLLMSVPSKVNVTGLALDYNKPSTSTSNSYVGQVAQELKQLGKSLISPFKPTRVEPATQIMSYRQPSFKEVSTYGAEQGGKEGFTQLRTLELGTLPFIIPGVGGAIATYFGGKAALNIVGSKFDPKVVGREAPLILLPLATEGLIKGVNYLKQPIEYSAPIGSQIRELKNVIYDTGKENVNYLGNVRTTNPDVIAVQTTKFRDIIGMKPLSVKIIPGNIYDQPVSGLINRETGMAQGISAIKLQGPSTKVIKVNEVKGLTTEAQIPLQNVPKYQDYVSKNFFNQFGPTITKEGVQPTFYTGEAQIRSGIGAPGRPDIRLMKFGGGKQEVLIASRPPLVSEVPKSFSLIEVTPKEYRIIDAGGGVKVGVKLPEDSQIFNVKAATKTSTSLSPRASGNIDYLTGETKVIRINTPSDLSENIIPKTSRTIQKQSPQQLVATSTKMVASVPAPKVILPKQVSATPLDTYISSPTIVGGLGKVTSAYFGKGTIGEDIQYLSPKVSKSLSMSITGNAVSTPKVSTAAISIPAQSSSLSSKTISNFAQPTATTTKEETRTIQPLAFVEVPREVVRESLNLNQAQATVQTQALGQQQATRTTNVFQPAQPVPNRPFNPRPNEPTIKIPKITNKRPKRFRTSGKEVGFIPQIRRRGKFFDIGKPVSNVREALQVGIRQARETLGASVRVRKVGTNTFVDIGKIGSPGFAPSKRAQNILVQRRGFRLSSLGERREIQQSRRRRRNIFL